MLYERSSQPALSDGLSPRTDILGWTSFRVAEPPMRYSRRRPARKPERVGMAPSEEIERRVRARGHGARWRRIMALNRRISTALTGDQRATWLSLEECLHAYWLEVALEHYQAGFEAGRVRAYAVRVGSRSRDLRTRLQALAAALAQLIADLEKREESF
jgi:hypothetical protein